MGIVSPGFSGRRRATTRTCRRGSTSPRTSPSCRPGPRRGSTRRLGAHGHHRDRRRAPVELGGAAGAAAGRADRRPALRHPVVQAGTTWRGVSLDTLLADVETAPTTPVDSYGGYTTNLPLEDLLDGKAGSLTVRRRAARRRARRAGPAAGAAPVPVEERQVGARHHAVAEDEPGFWETAGYHNYGDPWREQRYWGE